MEIPCPTCKAEMASGRRRMATLISDAQTRRVLPADSVAKYERLQLALAVRNVKSLFMCRKPGCFYTYSLETDDSSTFACAVCGDQYCTRWGSLHLQ